jgi:preprotein translocase subunit SecG
MLVSPSVIAEIDSNGDGVFSEVEERAYAEHVLGDLSITIDGQSVQPKLVSWSFPQPAQMRDGLGEIHIEYTADLPPGGSNRSLILANHHLNRTSVYLVNVTIPEDHNTRILAQKRNEQQTVYELDYEQAGAVIGASRTSWTDLRIMLHGVQFSSLFHLGMRHIAEGTDHLLFLITLLLPAPLLLAGRRWGPPAGVRQSLLRILGIVTAFTIGHSITLTLAALGALHVASRPIEVLIAVSIFVSALHTLRPIVPGKEALIAGFFGLIHGLAFAATLDRLGLGRWERMTGIFAFNVGIEAMQMLVVAAILPSLMLMSRTRAYSLLRIGGALFAGAASLGWIVERLFDIETPVDTIVNVLARHALWIAAGFFVLSLVSRLLPDSRAQQTAHMNRATALPITQPFFKALDQ